MDDYDEHMDHNKNASFTPPPISRTSPSSRQGLSWSQSVEMNYEMKAQEVSSAYLCVTNNGSFRGGMAHTVRSLSSGRIKTLTTRISYFILTWNSLPKRSRKY